MYIPLRRFVELERPGKAMRRRYPNVIAAAACPAEASVILNDALGNRTSWLLASKLRSWSSMLNTVFAEKYGPAPTYTPSKPPSGVFLNRNTWPKLGDISPCAMTSLAGTKPRYAFRSRLNVALYTSPTKCPDP